MANTFFVSDTHFGHAKICQFLSEDGSKLRPWDDIEQMNEDMVRIWNEVVRPQDKVYHLGDVVINRKYLPILERLNGDKVLVKGNHDIFPLKDYVKYFRDIRAYHVVDNLICSHIPVHPDSKGRFRGNVHGHLHSRRVMADVKMVKFNNCAVELIPPKPVIDSWYFCVSVENLEYRPISLDEIRKIYTLYK